MAIAVEGGLDGGMAELGLDELGVGPLSDQEGCVGVVELSRVSPNSLDKKNRLREKMRGRSFRILWDSLRC